MNDHFQERIYKCFVVQACESERVHECLSREGDCVLFRNVEWFRGEDETTTRFGLLSDTVRITSCTLAPPVFQHYFSVSPAETLKSFTELRLLFWVFLFCRHSKGRDPNLWPSQTHTVLDDCPLFSQLKLFYKPLKCVVRKRWRCKHVCRGECFNDSTPLWVFVKSYMPLYDVCTSVLCKRHTGRDARAAKSRV